MNKLIAFITSLFFCLSAAFAADSTSSATATSDSRVEVSPQIRNLDPSSMFYLESRRDTEVSKTLKHGQNIFLIEAPGTLTPDQIFKCFQTLNLEDTKTGAVLVKTATSRQPARIEFFGLRSVLMNDSKPEEFHCN